jgi:hypothetical protein
LIPIAIIEITKLTIKENSEEYNYKKKNRPTNKIFNPRICKLSQIKGKAIPVIGREGP